MPNDYYKDVLGVEDISFDTPGTNTTFSRTTSIGGSHNIKKLNAGHIPILLALRTAALYDTDTMASADDINEALTNIAASLASVHKFSNEAILDLITSAGSGAIISVSERAKLNALLDLGSGKIITDAERAKLATLTNLTEEQLETLANLNDILDALSNTNVAYISDVKASGSDGGGGGSTGHRTRDLNTLDDPEGLVTSLVGNQFTLPAGKYELDISSVLYGSNGGVTYIYNVTDSAVEFQSTPLFPFLSVPTQSEFAFTGVIDISEAKVFELRCYLTAAPSTAFGKATSITSYNNIWSIIKLKKTS